MESDEDISLDEIQRNLKIWSPTIARELFQVARDQILAEERRQTLVVTKANALLGTSGLSLTLLVGMGRFQFENKLGHAFACFYFTALVAGVFASVSALWSMRVQEARTISANDIFSNEMLSIADGGDVPDPNVSTESTGVGTKDLHRFLTEHFWRVYAANSARLSVSASWVRYGQFAYGVFLICALLAAVMIMHA